MASAARPPLSNGLDLTPHGLEGARERLQRWTAASQLLGSPVDPLIDRVREVLADDLHAVCTGCGRFLFTPPHPRRQTREPRRWLRCTPFCIRLT